MPTPNELPEEIGGYKLIQKIKNSMVVLGFHKEDPDKQMAIKLFYPDPYAENRESILERLHAICQLEHPNIVKTHEMGEENGIIYAAMEYVPGENLYDLMKRNPRLHWGAAAEIAREITQGLVSAHAKDVPHLSLHPDRVLLGKGGQVKINFCNEGFITPSAEIVYYVSPELFLGQTLDKSADIYSLGAVIYHIVTGKPPLAGKPPKEMALKHRQLAPVLPNYGVADVPHSLSMIIERTLSKEIKHRYNNSFELLAAINNFLTNDIQCKHVFTRENGHRKLRVIEQGYQLASYKELLPKIVVKSESDKSFSQAVDEERDRKKQELIIDPLGSSQIKRKRLVRRGKTLLDDKLGQWYWLILPICLLFLILSITIMIYFLGK